MRLRKLPNMTKSLACLALFLLALLCVLYALYLAFLMPPLVKYGTAGGRADGRAVCAAVGRRADESYRADYHRQNPSPSARFGNNPFVAPAAEEIGRKAAADCLSETAVNTPLLVFRAAVLLIIGAASALLASRLRVS